MKAPTDGCGGGPLWSAKDLLEQLRYSMPAAVDVSIVTDRTVAIRASVSDVEFELIMSMCLVALVTFLFLHNLPATFIPVTAVPLSLIGTFGIMYLAGFSLNNLTLMALAIATGFVVDDAIVVIENISRYRELGFSPKDAALKGARQTGFTIISLTLSLVVVLIPLLFMRDVVGRLFREFAVTVAVSVLLSGVISLTRTPMMCGHILRQRRKGEEGKLEKALPLFFNWAVAKYDNGLKRVFRHQRLTPAVTILTLIVTVGLYVAIPKGFIPVQDTGVLYESYIHPVTILSTGALLALMLCGLSLDLVSIIGLILLIGIVKKNGIMMVDFALDVRRNEGKTPQEAIHQACLLRFRPILMTTMAALFGALPMMLGRGMGSELRNPLGIAMVGGLILSQVLTLFTTPVVYLYFGRLSLAVQHRLRSDVKSKCAAEESAQGSLPGAKL